ncbi:uncharacterized protein KZ484_010903 [Pholidichthys leucotaenia]
MEPRREDFPEQHVCGNKFSPDQQLWNHKENSGLEQEEPEPPQVKVEHEEQEHLQVKVEQEEPEPPQVKVEQEEPEAPQVKEEQEELFINQEGEQLVVKLEADTFMVSPVSEEKQQSEAEPNSEQLLSHNSVGTKIQDEEESRHVDSGSTKEEEPKLKKRRLKTGSHHEDSPQLHNCKEEEVLTVQQLCNQERNSSLDQEEQDAAQFSYRANWSTDDTITTTLHSGLRHLENTKSYVRMLFVEYSSAFNAIITDILINKLYHLHDPPLPAPG